MLHQFEKMVLSGLVFGAALEFFHYTYFLWYPLPSMCKVMWLKEGLFNVGKPACSRLSIVNKDKEVQRNFL